MGYGRMYKVYVTTMSIYATSYIPTRGIQYPVTWLFTLVYLLSRLYITMLQEEGTVPILLDKDSIYLDTLNDPCSSKTYIPLPFLHPCILSYTHYPYSHLYLPIPYSPLPPYPFTSTHPHYLSLSLYLLPICIPLPLFIPLLHPFYWYVNVKTLPGLLEILLHVVYVPLSRSMS